MLFCPAELRRRYHEERVLPFIGAGVSMSLSWEDSKGNKMRGPSWEELVSQATKLLGFSDPSLARVRGTDLQILEYFKRKNNQETAKLTNWLYKYMDPPDDALKKSLIHKELVELRKCRFFYTTNFDNFIERAFTLCGRASTVVAFEAEMGIERSCEIVKFHGDLEHPGEIVLTESDFEKRFSLSTPLDHRLRSDLLGRVILFIGYSFRDPNVSYLFRLFTDQHWDQPGSLAGSRAYIAVADPSDFEIELFEARRITVIPIRRKTQTEDIGQLLNEMRG
jgi:SIR2-like domain